MDELIAQAAAQMGISAEMVERSARARAASDGTSIEAVLAAWTGGEAPPVSAAPVAAAPSAPSAAAAPPPAAPSGPVVEELPPVAADAEPEAEPEPEPEEEEAVPAGAVPRWLAAVFLVIPLLAIGYAMFVPNGPDCGQGGQLAVDPVTGVAVNCDGSDYGTDVVDFFSIGQGVYSQCSACHGVDGAGGALFPALSGGAVLATFPEGQCGDHVEWVRVGTSGWPDATYGANQTAVGGSGAVMPAFGSALSEEDLRSVVLYERVAFGGQGLAGALTDCGLDGAEDAVAAP